MENTHTPTTHERRTWRIAVYGAFVATIGVACTVTTTFSDDAGASSSPTTMPPALTAPFVCPDRKITVSLSGEEGAVA